ncbi:MAG: magnesium transporter [Planctomyces sp.]|nr:magnesium transporter [Planctomyces sp.]
MNPTAALIGPEVQELIAARALSELREVLHGIEPADVAEVFRDLPPDQAALAFRVLPRDDAGAVFSYMPVQDQEALILHLADSTESGIAALVESMVPDDRARLLDELPAEVAQRVLGTLSPETRRETQSILGYEPRSVGRLMTPDYVRIGPEWTAARALEHVRRHGRDAETINYVYVTDPQGVLIDDIRLRQLIMADPDQTVRSLMNNQFVALRADQPETDAVDALQRYDRAALPVVDTRGVLLGIVTFDDVADVAQREATEDIHKLGGVRALEEPYGRATTWALVRKRAPWLVLLFMSEILTTSALSLFEQRLAQATVLALFIPAIISAGGNAGNQSATLVIRALALREIGTGDWWRLLRREALSGVLLGVMIAAIGFGRINLWGALGWWDGRAQDHFVMLALAIALALVGVIAWGSMVGAMLPILLRSLRIDPATSSNPFVATLVDVTGIAIYFGCATVVLSGSLLAPAAPGPTHAFDTPAGRMVIFTASNREPVAVAPADTPGAATPVTPIASQ